MVNQKTFESLYHYYFDEEIKTDDQSEEELYHHGVLGQSWGKKHGPPYPLDGIDKKIARAEARKKKERERKLKKMQRAAKKARREKKREEKREADILKKKQKLMKSGDMDQIRKNAKLFTNEELAYIMDREQLKKGLKGKDERSADEKMELFMKRMGQIASIASSAQQVLGAAKTGMDVMQSYKATKVKELEADEKRMKALREEFEMRFQGDERSSSEAKRFLDDRINDRNYKPSKEKAPKESTIDKKERKAAEDLRSRRLDEYYEEMRELDAKKKKEKREERESLKEEKKAKREEKKRETPYEQMIREAEERRKQAKSLYEERQRNQQRADERKRRSEAKAEKAYNKSWESNRSAHEQAFEEFMKRTTSNKTKDYGKKWADDIIDATWSDTSGSSSIGKDWISAYYGLNGSRSSYYLPYKN